MSDMTDPGTRTVVCTNPECGNNGALVQVPDHGGLVICGACGVVLAEAR